jgi:gamma-glutamyltranspeptidase/glutathione hydrolase
MRGPDRVPGLRFEGYRSPMLPSRRGSTQDPLRSERSSVLARRGVVATSVPAATAAGVEMLRRGGNAVDAAIAAAAVLTVVEPMQCGLGGDAFALLWSAREDRLVGLNGSGRAPAAATRDHYRARGLTAIEPAGILSASVPGVVHAWDTLARRHGSLPLATLLEPAIHSAEQGFPVSELVAHYWRLLAAIGALRNDAARKALLPDGSAPHAGDWFRPAPGLARVLREIAEGGAEAFYCGHAAAAIVAASDAEDGCFSARDLAAHESTWVEPISAPYRGVEVVELPPNGPGLAALQALRILACFDPEEAPLGSALEWHRRIEAVKLAMLDRDAVLADPEHAAVPVDALLDADYARRRAALVGDRALDGAAPGLGGDTTYLCAADAEGNLVSFIQSLFTGFGSGIGCGDTGILLQSRAAGFVLDATHPNCLAPHKRPAHTILPGLLLRDGRPWMAFGIMGGDIQPQAHLCFVSNLVDHGCHAQEAIDRARFRFKGGRTVLLETPELLVATGAPGSAPDTPLGVALAARGHDVVGPGSAMADLFGGGQAIAREADGLLVGASDRRKDGCAFGLW